MSSRVDGGELAGEADPAPHGQRFVHDVVSEDARAAGVRLEQSGDDPDERGLPRAVRAQQPEHASWLDPQIEAIERDDLTEGFPHILDLDRCLR